MNYLFTGILIGVVLALIFIVFYLYKRFFRAEKEQTPTEFYQERERERPNIEINRMPGAPPELNEIMASLNQTGNQMVADAAYDNVDTSILENQQ